MRGNRPRPALVAVAVWISVLLVAGAAAARAADPVVEATQVTAGGAPPQDQTEASVLGIGAVAEPAAAEAAPASTAAMPALTAPSTTATSVTRRAATPADPATTETTPAAPPTTRVAGPPPTRPPSVAAPAPPPPPPQTEVIGPGAWRSTINGITTTLQISPAAPRVGDVVHLSITSTHSGDGCCIVTVYPGDGAMVLPESGVNQCIQGAPSVWHKEIDHVYRTPGMVVIHVQPSALPCRLPPPPELPMMINAHLYASTSIEPAS